MLHYRKKAWKKSEGGPTPPLEEGYGVHVAFGGGINFARAWREKGGGNELAQKNFPQAAGENKSRE